MLAEIDARKNRMGKVNKSAFARKCGVEQSTMAGYFSGKSSPTVENSIKIAESNGVSLMWLITGEGPMMKDGQGEQLATEPRLRHIPEQKDPFDQAMDEYFEKVKNWQADENGRTMKTAIEFFQEFPLRFPEMTEWLKKRGGNSDPGRFQEPARNSGNGIG